MCFSTFINHLALTQHTYCARSLYKCHAQDSYKCRDSEFEKILRNNCGVKKSDDTCWGMERRSLQGRDGLIGEPQKKSSGSDQRSRKCVQGKRFENSRVFRGENFWEGNFKTLNVQEFVTYRVLACYKV